jgi:hypothetical protein
MRRRTTRLIGSILAAALALSGCASTGALGEYRFRGASLASHMRSPPEPRVFADYPIRIDRGDPVGSVISVGSSIAKAAGVRAAEEHLQRALAAVDIPEEVRLSTLEECADVLDCDAIERGRSADFVLELEIREYGIDATSWNAQAELRVDILAVLTDGAEGRDIWRARVSEQAPLTPALFGLGSSVGNIVTAATLADLSEDEIGRGLMRLVRRVATRVADRLARDFGRSR